MTSMFSQVCVVIFDFIAVVINLKKSYNYTTTKQHNEILSLPAIKPKQFVKKKLRVEVKLQGSGEPECSL